MKLFIYEQQLNSLKKYTHTKPERRLFNFFKAVKKDNNYYYNGLLFVEIMSAIDVINKNINFDFFKVTIMNH